MAPEQVRIIGIGSETTRSEDLKEYDMAREDFLRDIRRAISFMSPRVEVDNKFTDPAYIERMLRGLDLWISPKNVEAYKPEYFDDLEPDTQSKLQNAVQEFLKAAKTVDPQKPTTQAQRDAALPPFLNIVQIVQKILHDEWLSVSTALLNDAESWAKEREWPTKRFSKEIAEDTIGTYKLERLVFAVESAQLALIPVGRFAPGTDGMFDLAVMPAYDSAMVARRNGRWYVHPLPGDIESASRAWSKEEFVSKSLALARLP